MHFERLPFLTDYVLNPRWLTYGVYTIMYSEEAKTAQGRLSQAGLISILKKANQFISDGRVLRYPADRCAIIADAMIAFRVAYRLGRANLSFRRFSRLRSRTMISNPTARSPSASISAASCRAMFCPRFRLSISRKSQK
jgi:C-terminal of Roc, COR, domain